MLSITSSRFLSAGWKLFLSERDSDISIQVETENGLCHIPAHRLVLSSMSDVLRTMLSSNMIEGNTKIITITDSSPVTVKQFLKYLYLGVVDLYCWVEAVCLLKMSHKYGVHTLVNLCEAFLLTQIVISNVCFLHEISVTYSLKVLHKETLCLLLNGGFIVSSTAGFFELRPSTLENVLSCTQFNMENEASVLSCLKEWAVSECSRKCIPLSRENVLSNMEPFLKYIRWNIIPESHRTYIPAKLVEKHRNRHLPNRSPFHMNIYLQRHISYVKLVVELGRYQDKELYTNNQLWSLKFDAGNHVYLSGFRLVGLFRLDMYLISRLCSLVLTREDHRLFMQFDLNSLPWTCGSIVGKYVWRELLAYLPYPIRVDPFHTYSLSLKYGGHMKFRNFAKWPRTRLDSEKILTDIGVISFRTHGPCYGLTQLFLLPAPPYKNICNKEDD